MKHETNSLHVFVDAFKHLTNRKEALLCQLSLEAEGTMVNKTKFHVHMFQARGRMEKQAVVGGVVSCGGGTCGHRTWKDTRQTSEAKDGVPQAGQ